jgi:coenzyme F420-reducing hydrogenase alpha subunit
MRIRIDHIAKIEGHAGFVADIVNGKAEKALFSVLEGSRLLEGILRDRKYTEVSQITARICGVCPVVHNLTSLKALEDAFGVKVSEQTILLRKLMMLGQIINSHALHVFFFSLSDFFSIENDLELIEKYPQKTQQAVAIREFGNKIIEIIGGRSIHPLTPEVGGFIRLPKVESIKQIGENAKKILPQAIELARLFAKLDYPKFERETSFVSLINSKEYPIYAGEISINGKQKYALKDFMQLVKETQVSYDGVKRTNIQQKPYMVGAIARINNNHKQLNNEAQKILRASKIKLPSQNPFHNILAQAVEIVHCLEEVIKLARGCHPQRSEESHLCNSSKDSSASPQNDKMAGYGAIEAPRGILFYFYEIGDNGLVKNCNIITPTAQNIARLEEDLKIWLPQLQNLSEREIQDKIRMLIRAYDPCLTCATH